MGPLQVLILVLAGSLIVAWSFWSRRGVGVVYPDSRQTDHQRAEVGGSALNGAAILPYEPLSLLSPGESAEVIEILPSYQGPQRRRLLDLGLVPGTRIEARLRSASGDPVAYEIRGALIALRRDQADQILIDRGHSGPGDRSGKGVRSGE